MRPARPSVPALVIAALVAFIASCASEIDDASLPAGTRPFPGTVELRYAGFERFSHTWRDDMDGPWTGRRLLEGWVMDGVAKPSADGIAWSYSLSNIGHDQVVRERGRLEVTNDAWGNVRQPRVLSDAWPPQARPRLGADAMFDEADLASLSAAAHRGPSAWGT